MGVQLGKINFDDRLLQKRGITPLFGRFRPFLSVFDLHFCRYGLSGECRAACRTPDWRHLRYVVSCCDMSCTCRDISFAFTTLAKDDILFRQSCRHDIYVSSRHDISRHDIYLSSCRDISRHVATCRDVTRHILTFVV